MALIHSTALIDPKAQLSDDVEVGPYSIIGPNVIIDQGTTVAAHVVIEGHTHIGRNNRIFQFCSLGAIPQDMKYKGESTRLEIGNNNVIREFCSFNLGTVQGNGVTKLGNDNWIMANVHLAHDCTVGNHTIFANNASLAGHVTIGDWVFLGGYSLIHQFGIVGDHAMTAFASAVSQDIPPFVTAAGNRAVPTGINSEGLKRRGFSSDAIAAIKDAYKTLYRRGLSLEEAKAKILAQAELVPEMQPFIPFFEHAVRGIMR